MEHLLRGGAFGTSILLTSIVTRDFCPEASFEPSRAPLQPPPWVFRVVWPLLFVTTGASWVLADASATIDVLYALLTVLCCLWLPLYTCLRYRRLSVAVLVASVAVALAALLASTNRWRWFLAPLVAWLAFATYLNAYQIRGERE